MPGWCEMAGARRPAGTLPLFQCLLKSRPLLEYLFCNACTRPQAVCETNAPCGTCSCPATTHMCKNGICRKLCGATCDLDGSNACACPASKPVCDNRSCKVCVFVPLALVRAQQCILQLVWLPSGTSSLASMLSKHLRTLPHFPQACPPPWDHADAQSAKLFLAHTYSYPTSARA